MLTKRLNVESCINAWGFVYSTFFITSHKNIIQYLVIYLKLTFNLIINLSLSHL